MSIELRVLCEGPTERGFVTQVLAPHLREFNVFPRSESLTRAGFGTVTFKHMYEAIKRDVGRSRSHQYVTTMIDLYGLSDYPGAEKQPGESVLDRVARIETKMSEALPNNRFIPYIQVHEFEALVFVDLDAVPPQFPDGEADGAPERLKAQVGATAPEDIDDGKHTAPSKRLIAEIPAYANLKAIVGPAIAARIGLANLRRLSALQRVDHTSPRTRSESVTHSSSLFDGQLRVVVTVRRVSRPCRRWVRRGSFA